MTSPSPSPASRDSEEQSMGPVEAPSSGWHPIETAPKDGREVILREGSRVGAACWVKWPDTYDYDGAPNADGGEGWTVGYDGDEWRAPDAWQPMPAAHGVTACPHGVPHCYPCEQCDAVGVFARGSAPVEAQSREEALHTAGAAGPLGDPAVRGDGVNAPDGAQR